MLQAVTSTLLLLIFSCASLAQDYPDRIRGYKVHKAEIAVNDPDSKSKFSVEAEFEEPRVESVGLGGLDVVFESSFVVRGKSGKVDFITFEDFTVNGISVSVEDYEKSFKFKKNKSVKLEDPVRLRISPLQTLKAAYRELRRSKDKWRVRGKVFVFGKFRKFGFKFKRVVPVEVDFEIDNPV